MTNLPEAKLAREAEIALATMAMITDYDCWKVEEEPCLRPDRYRASLGQRRDGQEGPGRRHPEDSPRSQLAGASRPGLGPGDRPQALAGSQPEEKLKRDSGAFLYDVLLGQKTRGQSPRAFRNSAHSQR